MKLLKKLFLFLGKTVGFNYMLNLSSMEIHDLDNEKYNCMTSRIKKYKLTDKSKVSNYLETGFNGCRWCYKQKDRG